jgi:hypothetical protein
LDALGCSYRGLFGRGFSNPWLRFYLANLCQIRNYAHGFAKSFCHDEINDEFYAQCNKSSMSDLFVPEKRAWIQLRFVQRQKWQKWVSTKWQKWVSTKKLVNCILNTSGAGRMTWNERLQAIFRG